MLRPMFSDVEVPESHRGAGGHLLHLCARSQEWWRGIERLKLRAWALGVGEVALVECSVAFAYQALTPARARTIIIATCASCRSICATWPA